MAPTYMHKRRQKAIIGILGIEPKTSKQLAEIFNEQAWEGVVGWTAHQIYHTLKTMESHGTVKQIRTDNKIEWSLVENANNI